VRTRIGEQQQKSDNRSLAARQKTTGRDRRGNRRLKTGTEN
jgi:hypothetical protein